MFILLWAIHSTAVLKVSKVRHEDELPTGMHLSYENKSRHCIPMASTPGQNVHLVLPHNHVVVSSSHLANSSSQLVLSSSLSQRVVELSRRVVESSRRVVESSRRVVFFDLLSRCAITCLFFNLSYYLSTRHVAFQLFVQRSRALFLQKEGT